MILSTESMSYATVMLFKNVPFVRHLSTFEWHWPLDTNVENKSIDHAFFIKKYSHNINI